MGAGTPGGASSTQQGGQGGQAGGAVETLRQAVSGVGDVAGQVKEKVQDVASGAADRLSGAWESTKRGMRQGYETVAETAEDFWTGTSNFIRRHPMASVMAAFGLGCLCAMAFSAPRWLGSDMTDRMSRHSS
jgi:hypothetical protein